MGIPVGLVGDLGETEGVIVGCSDDALLGDSVGEYVGEKEGRVVGAIVPVQVPHVTLQSLFIRSGGSVSSE